MRWRIGGGDSEDGRKRELGLVCKVRLFLIEIKINKKTEKID